MEGRQDLSTTATEESKKKKNPKKCLRKLRANKHSKRVKNVMILLTAFYLRYNKPQK